MAHLNARYYIWSASHTSNGPGVSVHVWFTFVLHCFFPACTWLRSWQRRTESVKILCRTQLMQDHICEYVIKAKLLKWSSTKGKRGFHKQCLNTTCSSLSAFFMLYAISSHTCNIPNRDAKFHFRFSVKYRIITHTL